MFSNGMQRTTVMRRTMHLLPALFALLLAACAHAPAPGGRQPGLPDTDAQARLQQGLTRYRESRYDAALADLSAAAASGQLKAADELNARKHLAFIHCISNREA